MQRTPCSPVDRKALAREVAQDLDVYLDACKEANGDLTGVEAAAGRFREKVMARVCQAGAEETMSRPVIWKCPECGQLLAYHDTQRKSVVLQEGVVDLLRGRYRCTACGKEYLPIDVLNDLERTSFSLGARQAGVRYAVQMAFAPASEWIRPIFPISAKSLERMVAETAGWLQEEHWKARQDFYGDRERPGLLPTGNPMPLVTQWQPRNLPADAVLCISADGGMVRSTTLGTDGRLEWFEARAATISVTYQGKELAVKKAGGKLYLAGVLDLDELFELLGAAHATLPGELRALRCVFTGDGGPWWERAKEHFPHAREILDLYHAGENLGNAAAVCFGDGTAKTRNWRTHARDWVKEPGKLEKLLGELFRNRPSVVTDPEGHHALRKKIAYFRKHRRRMRYWEYEAEGMPLGSGVIESGIKQTVIARMRQAGMKWTEEHADAMLRLRSAWLSSELPHVFQRRRQECLQAARAFSETLQCAA